MNAPTTAAEQSTNNKTPAVSEREKWRGANSMSRRLHIANSQFFVKHPQCTAAINDILRIAENCKLEGKGNGLLIMAGSGAGKTYLAKHIQALKPRDDSGDVSKVPTLYFKVPAAPTESGLASNLLRALGDPNPKGKADDMVKRAILLIQRVGTEVIFLDDVQDIPEKRGDKGVMQMGTWIRDLIDDSKCLVVLLGTFAANQVARGNGQVNRRSIKTKRINYFSMTNTKNITNTKRFLDNLDKALPLAESSNLVESSIALRFVYATNGITSLMLDVVKEAVCIAVEKGREHLSLLDLAEAFELHFGEELEDINPFRVQDVRPLTQENEVFHNWYDTSNPEYVPEKMKSQRTVRA